MKEQKQGFAVWITGLPASGKSTLTAALTEKLAAENIAVQVLESDAMRPVLAPDLGYEPPDREKFYRLLITVGELLVQNGVNVIFDATGAERQLREQVRGRLEHFIEVHIDCPL
ncbi:MAG: adenylyl-sulfate kinase, partial [Armatimonadetes bacterium]|nr:adenylyl-sulfate kinase [Armatimonadota bacterium]NIM24688.1 adenylyl-sulfate kinase [Armatimonadota bacterium]NIM68566.1 adenylyl-sulfate kinase [Armatimonadota bacterium]NIM76944.1 adenylyl-sulfate kinase [Armatimonadota bacterium]NIN06762.1 adenylyl-sulfate kinase [Armatimonadota bacterium]